MPYACDAFADIRTEVLGQWALNSNRTSLLAVQGVLGNVAAKPVTHS